MLLLILVFAGLVFGTIYFVISIISKYNLKIKLVVSVLISGLIFFIFYISGVPLRAYYRQIFENSPYEFSEFKSFVFKYGVRDSMLNTYNSATGEYQYLNNRDSLIKTHLYLNKSEILYLHHKAGELGFWDFPPNELSKDTTNPEGVKPLRYLMQFNYRQKSKTVLFETSYDGLETLKAANSKMVKEIEKVLAEAEDRQKK
jgi:hypothetical protein